MQQLEGTQGTRAYLIYLHWVIIAALTSKVPDVPEEFFRLPYPEAGSLFWHPAQQEGISRIWPGAG